ncbi:hypothetical protein [Neorhodopirellula lusitana]
MLRIFGVNWRDFVRFGEDVRIIAIALVVSILWLPPWNVYPINRHDR